jgi:septum formation protein
MGSRFPSDFQLLLASQSPRRHSLLRDLGVPFTVVPSEADEALSGGCAEGLAERNALAKARGALLPGDMAPSAFVLGTDTLVAVEEKILGKPASAGEAVAMLDALAGRTHTVVTGVALRRVGAEIAAGEQTCATGCAVTKVTFTDLSPAQRTAYLESGEWKGKAGGYAIQGLAGLFVSSIHGEYSNVVGLPLCLLARLFRDCGFDLVAGGWL